MPGGGCLMMLFLILRSTYTLKRAEFGEWSSEVTGVESRTPFVLL